jgi:hypothetical protein
MEKSSSSAVRERLDLSGEKGVQAETLLKLISTAGVDQDLTLDACLPWLLVLARTSRDLDWDYPLEELKERLAGGPADGS